MGMLLSAIAVAASQAAFQAFTMVAREAMERMYCKPTCTNSGRAGRRRGKNGAIQPRLLKLLTTVEND